MILKNIPLVIMLFMVLAAHTQSIDTSKIKLDLLRAPSSPGATLLGFSISDIEKPSDVSDFMLTLQSATNSNSLFPTNYAVDLAPFWIFRSKGLTTDKFNTGKFTDVFKQSFVISTAIRNADSSTGDFNKNNLYNSVGTKFSILRGKLSNKTIAALESIHELQTEIAGGLNLQLSQQLKSDSAYQRLKKNRQNLLLETKDPNHPEVLAISVKMEKRQEAIKNKILLSYSEQLSSLQKQAASFKVERFGFFVDFAGGISIEYINRTFNNSRVYNAGTWLTFGANYKNGLTVLGITRFLHNPDKVFTGDQGNPETANISTLDAGARIIYNHPGSRFNISTEAIYRSVLTNNTIDPSWRWVLNAEYDIGNNTRLTFLFGRAFNGTTTQDGNLIAALNFLKGLGNFR
jgi:hypothetical protein